jgi:hypothetical protein
MLDMRIVLRAWLYESHLARFLFCLAVFYAERQKPALAAKTAKNFALRSPRINFEEGGRTFGIPLSCSFRVPVKSHRT